MKSISLYVDNGSWLCKVHPFTKLAYIATAISVPLLVGKLSFFAIFIALSLAVLASGRLLKRVVPLIAFSFTILITIFLIHGLSQGPGRSGPGSLFIFVPQAYIQYFRHNHLFLSAYSAICVHPSVMS